MYLCHGDLRIVLIFNNRKNKYEKKYYKDFYSIKCYIKSKLQIFGISFKIIHFHYVIMEQ